MYARLNNIRIYIKYTDNVIHILKLKVWFILVKFTIKKNIILIKCIIDDGFLLFLYSLLNVINAMQLYSVQLNLFFIRFF